jgi:tight adherence protein B
MTETLQSPRIESRPEFADILRAAECYGGRRAALGDRINRGFDRLMLQSGSRLSPAVALRLCILGAIALGGSVFVAFEDLLTTAVATGVGAFVPIAVLLVMRRRRESKMRKQLPRFVESLLCTARTGRGLQRCLEMAVPETPLPLATEIERSARRLEMGVGALEALGDLPERTGLPEMNRLVSALGAHDRDGSDLIAVLEHLETAIRQLS